MASRVGSSNMLRTWSMSTVSGLAASSERVLPSGRSELDCPGRTSRYLSPRADLERTDTCVSSGSGLTLSSSFRSTFAVAVPFSCSSGETVSTVPTRMPPTRTSLPFTSESALGTWTEIL
jgi:hypothetical protein